MAAKISDEELEALAKAKTALVKDFLDWQPPEKHGGDLLSLWEQIYDDEIKNIVLKTVTGPSHDDTNPVFPYEKLQAVVRDGGNWKWPRMWQRFDEIERRGEAYREGEVLNFEQPSKNAGINAQKVLVVGGGPIGIRLAIELVMGGHIVTVVEKRRELHNEDGSLKSLGFTNRINRPHMYNFVRNDLAKLNGKDFMSRQAAYPVFTEPETSSIGIDELQCLLLKNALLLGVDFRLGVGYVNASVVLEDDSMRPSWNVELQYDAKAAEQFKMQPGKNLEDYDVLIGCDGPRSTVRETQSRYFGDVEKRKFMDCVGIVANVQKLGRKRLRELGFEHGQEPQDMSRGKQVFKEFFKKIEDEADADIETLIYYKASNHNYCIVIPKRKDLIKNGLSGKVYTFAQGRADAGSKGDEEKNKLKGYMTRVLKAAGVPLDEQAENGGFVSPPNDCMSFDFAECWNTKKSLHFNLPPPNYSVAEDGEWEGRKLVPVVALAGDALSEPFWPMGLGLKRGYQAIMDTSFCVDNLYNSDFFRELKAVPEDNWGWDDHFEALAEQCARNFELCNRLQVEEKMMQGEYPDKGPEMTALRKKLKDAEKPPLNPEIDPWTRYEALALERRDRFNKQPREVQEAYIPPMVTKAVKMWEYYLEVSKGGKSGEIDYQGKELISINGKVTGGFKQHGRRSVTSVVTAGGTKKPVAGSPAKAGGIGALLAQGLPNGAPAGGLGALIAGAPPMGAPAGGLGALIAGAPPRGVPKGAGGMAALMMGHNVKRQATTDEFVDAGAAERIKASRLEEVTRRIATLTKDLEAAKAEQALLL